MADSEKPKVAGRTFAALMQDYGPRLSLQTPADVVNLMIFCMPLYGAFRVCIEAEIFRKLARASPEPLTISELARDLPGGAGGKEVDAEDREAYLARMLRGVCALNFVDEVGPTVYLANELTLTMTEPGYERGFRFAFDVAYGPKSSTMEIVNWSKNNGYTAPNALDDGPWQRARDIVGTPAFQVWGKDGSIQDLSMYMQRLQQDRLNWSEWFPADVLFDGYNDSDVFMVDVGGGYGHDLSGMVGRYPEKRMRLVLQDQPDVIKVAREQKIDSRIELMEHDFFASQPVTGAHIFFMHKIMHDWQDKDCARILSQLRDAMTQSSRIFINDMVLPDQGSPLLFPAYDIMMLACLSAQERSESMWRRLVSQVHGLKIRKIWQAPELRGEGIVEIVRVDA